MKNLSTKQKTNSLLMALLTLLVIFFLINMIVSPAKFIEQSLDGISAWAFNVLPSVLPFMFFTRLLSSIGQLEKITHPLGKFSRKLFGTPSISIYTFLMAILSGYPVGSKMVADLYSQKSITKQDAFRMSAFCSTSGPMFIVGAVGTMMFKSTTVGYVLFISHIIGAFLNGLIYRNLTIANNKIKIFNFHKNKEIENNEKNKQISESPEKKSIDISEIVLSSTLSILSVGCIITIFFIIIECFSPILNLLPESLAGFWEGIIEITKGCLSLSNLPNLNLAVLLCSFVISFGGISTLLQSITMLNKVEMPLKIFTLQKLTHAILSTLLTAILIIFI